MSHNDHFRLSLNQLCIHSAIFLVGIVLASIFIYLSPIDLQNEFFKKFGDYYDFAGLDSCIILILQECFWLMLIGLFAYIPNGSIINVLILLYKGFSIGIVSSIACKQLGFSGLKYTFLLILPPNLFYILSLCIATQISFMTTTLLSGRHTTGVKPNKSLYLISVFLTVIGGLIESCYVPWMYKILF